MMPSDRVLRWAPAVVDGTSVVSTQSLGRGGHRASGTFRVRIEGPAARATDVILKVPVPGWIRAAWVITNARALQLAETHGLAAPRLIAADLDGRASGTVTTLETFLSGSADLQDAPAHVLEGWQRQAGRAATSVPYWDAVAALNIPTVMHEPIWPGFADDGSPLDAEAVTERRDAFLRAALNQL
jgi:hypothetical protein